MFYLCSQYLHVCLSAHDVGVPLEKIAAFVRLVHERRVADATANEVTERRGVFSIQVSP